MPNGKQGECVNTVYLVDDDKIMLDDFHLKRGLFRACGFEICGSETNPVNALEEIRAMRPDAVLSDLKMPGLSGIELLEALRRDNIVMYFVIISAYNEFKDVRNFFHEYNGFDYILKPVSSSALSDLLTRIGAKLKGAQAVTLKKETSSRDLNAVLKYIHEYPAVNHTLESLGAKCSINPNSVSNLFSRHLNTTFTAYLTTLRMEKATELLRDTDMAVKSVAVTCGYTDYFYFARVFSKTYNKTPTEYRKAAQSAKGGA